MEKKNKTQTKIEIEIEVVNELDKLKRDGESYSDIIKRLIEKSRWVVSE
jgi:predicted CopG family antitoxin